MSAPFSGPEPASPRRRRTGYSVSAQGEVDDGRARRAVWRLLRRWVEEGKWEEVEHEDYVEVRPRKGRG